MAYDWIAWSIGLTTKAEVLAIAKRLRISNREAAALCMLAWEWADKNAVDGIACGMTLDRLDVVVGLPGFAKAMKKEKWVVELKRGLRFPKWERWNAKSTLARMHGQERAARHRAKKASENAGESGVTGALRDRDDVRHRTEQDVTEQTDPVEDVKDVCTDGQRLARSDGSVCFVERLSRMLHDPDYKPNTRANLVYLLSGAGLSNQAALAIPRQYPSQRIREVLHQACRRKPRRLAAYICAALKQGWRWT